jgi:hypothetical protein
LAAWEGVSVFFFFFFGILLKVRLQQMLGTYTGGFMLALKNTQQIAVYSEM